MTRTFTLAAIAATGALAIGAGTALSSGTTEPRPQQDQRAQQAGSGQQHRGMPGPHQGRGHGAGHGQQAATPATSTLTLSKAARADLLYMREEEKVAQDLYATLAARYPDAPFARITTSEARHASAVQRQLDRAGIADPTTGHSTGEFENPELQRLYDTLLAQGSASLEAALKVGALVEETDIADLRDAAATTKDAELRRVYANLERGSDHHLQAFAGQLAAIGVTYAPTVLSQADYDAIVG